MCVVAFEEGAWQVLEPVMLVEVSAPLEFQGAVISIINKRSGIMLSQEGSADWFNMYAEVSTVHLTMSSTPDYPV